MEVERAPVDVLFSCRRCQWEWRESFDLVRWTDYEGDVVESYFHGGVPVPSPALGRRCPACGGLNVAALDESYLPRAAIEPPERPLVRSRWETPEPARRGFFVQGRGFFRHASHLYEPRTRRFP